MGAGSGELSAIAGDLGRVIGELESISAGVRSDFKGIGAEKCSDGIDYVLGYLYAARKLLGGVDTHKFVEGYSNGGGGHSW